MTVKLNKNFRSTSQTFKLGHFFNELWLFKILILIFRKNWSEKNKIKEIILISIFVHKSIELIRNVINRRRMDDWGRDSGSYAVLVTRNCGCFHAISALFILCYQASKALIKFHCFQLFLALHGLRPVGINKVSSFMPHRTSIIGSHIENWWFRYAGSVTGCHSDSWLISFSISLWFASLIAWARH